MITCFTPAGFTRFVLSLSRFCDMNCTEALLFVNQCARANYDTFRADGQNGGPYPLPVRYRESVPNSTYNFSDFLKLKC